jgi:uncharacterized protein DUF3606
MSEKRALSGLNGVSIRMNINNHDDASFWARYLGCTPEELWAALTAVGDPDLVRDEIIRRRSRGKDASVPRIDP